MSDKKVLFAVAGGHGGHDRSNVGANGYVEADWALATSIALNRALNRQPSFKSVNLRPGDMSLSIEEKVQSAKDMGADVLIDLHTNAGGGRGSEVYVSVKRNKDKKVAACISSMTANHFNTLDRGVKTKVISSGTRKGDDYFGIIRGAADHGIRGFITESLFHDNPREVAILNDKQSSIDCAEIIAQAFCLDYGVVYVAPCDEDSGKENECMDNKEKLPVSPWAEKSLELAKELGLTDGTKPRVGSSREETAVIALRAVGVAIEAIKNGNADELLDKIKKLGL